MCLTSEWIYTTSATCLTHPILAGLLPLYLRLLEIINKNKKYNTQLIGKNGASLMPRWKRIHLLIQETQEAQV